VTSVSGVPGGDTARPDAARGQGRHAQARPPRLRQPRVRQAGLNQPGARQAKAAPSPETAETVLFSQWAAGYASERFGQPIAVLLAGAVTAASDLDAAALLAAGADLSFGLVDDDQPVTRAALGSHPGLDRCTLGDLRTVPLPQRSFDIVQATLLLDRIEHAELVLDRLVGALKPGGLLCLQVRDRDSAAGFLDRVLPGGVRRMIWRRHRPGRPGPPPAVYERVTSVRGIQSYALMRGLVIAEQQPLGGLAGGLRAAPRGYLAAQKLVAAASRGRLTAAHEELLYVMRKPENRFARIL
jgi:SAM-dependent methyltransferase